MKTLSALILLGLSSTVSANAIIYVEKPGDSRLSCDAIIAEINQMEAVMNEARSNKSNASLTTIGANAANRLSGFLGGSSNAASTAASSANQMASQNTLTANENYRNAEQRRSRMMRFYDEKNCD